MASILESSNFFIQCKNSGLYFDIEGGSLEAKAKLIQYSFNGGENQQFMLKQVGDYIAIICKNSNLALYVPCGTKETIQIEQYPLHSGDNQLFAFEKTGDYFFIKNKNSGLYLDVRANSLEPAEIDQYQFHGGENQQFKLIFK